MNTIFLKTYDIRNDEESVRTGLRDELKRKQANIRPNLIEVVHLDNSKSSIASYQLKNADIEYAHLT